MMIINMGVMVENRLLLVLKPAPTVEIKQTYKAEGYIFISNLFWLSKIMMDQPHDIVCDMLTSVFKGFGIPQAGDK